MEFVDLEMEPGRKVNRKPMFQVLTLHALRARRKRGSHDFMAAILHAPNQKRFGLAAKPRRVGKRR